MGQLQIFHLHQYKEHPEGRIARMLEGSHIAIVEKKFTPWSNPQKRWECQRCGRGGMWLSWGPHEGQIKYALTKHRCRRVEADRVLC